jgi:hypothetical protein
MRQHLVLVALLMVAGCGGATPEQKLQDEAHKQVQFLLDDPDSAHFMDDPLKIFPDTGIICGEVNSTNGNEQYVYVRGRGAALESDAPNFLPANEKCIEAMQLRTSQIQAQSPLSFGSLDTSSGGRQHKRSRKRHAHR